MNLHFGIRRTCFVGIYLGLVFPSFASAADTASELAAKLRSKQSGSMFVRIRMEIGSCGKQTLQIQIKSRVSDADGDIVYQILFPKERKGESVLLHRTGHKLSGTVFTPPNNLKSIGSAEIKQSLFGSDLSYEDIIDSPFAWSQQAIVGTENMDGTPCQILESKPGKGHTSSYSSVKSWVESRRSVPLRIEKYDSSGKVIRRINTTRVLLEGGDSLPVDLKVYGPGGTATHITGSRLKRGVSYPDTDFTPEGLKQLNPHTATGP